MNRYWGIGKDDFCYLAPKEVIQNLSACRKVGANYLLNVGPTGEGEILDYEKATLRRVGEWINHCSEAIYKGKPSKITGQGSDFSLEVNGRTFLFISNLAIDGHADVTIKVGGTGPRAFGNVSKKSLWCSLN